MPKVAKKSQKRSDVKESKKYTNMIEAYGAFWRRGYKEWAGTSSRSEYWWSYLMNWIICVLWVGLIVIVGLPDISGGYNVHLINPIGIVLGFGFFVFILASIIPFISMNVRRLHDIGLSAWWMLLLLLSPICEEMGVFVSLIFFIFSVLPTKVEGNPYQKFNK